MQQTVTIRFIQSVERLGAQAAGMTVMC